MRDPLRLLFKSKMFAINGPFERNVMRAVLLDYRYDAPQGTTLPVQVWVDGKLNSVLEFPVTDGETKQVFKSLPAWANVGNDIQFIVDETSNYNIEIHEVGLKVIPKKVRGYG